MTDEKRDKPDKPDKPGKRFGPDSSGREALDYVFAHVKTGPWSAAQYEQCHGIALWRKFLNRKPDATLAECLEEYERQMPRYNDTHWTYRLIEAFRGKVYPGFIKRVLALAPAEVAHDLIHRPTVFGIERDEVEILERRAVKAKIKQGKCPPKNIDAKPVVTARAKK